MAKKAKLSRRLGADVKRAGGQSAFRSRMGYLPSGYHAAPLKHAETLNPAQKTRIRGMHKELSAASFKRVYGFTKRK